MEIQFLAHEILWSDVLYSLEDWLSFYKNFFLSYKDHHKNLIEVSIKYLYLQIIYINIIQVYGVNAHDI